VMRITEVIEFYVTQAQAQAEAALGDVLRDEPEWKGELGVIAVEFDMSPQ
jgi:hypothetical protein